MRKRLRAAGIHFILSLIVAGLASILVFGVWYPYPYSEISGGRELYTVLICVDVVLGPLLTLAIFNTSKIAKELRRDMVVVVLLQLAGLGYGLWTVFVARPVHLVFEIDRFRVVHAIDVPADRLRSTAPGIAALPVTGPTLLAVRPFVDEREKVEATLAALQGVDLSVRPEFWQTYAKAQASVLEVGRPLAELKARFPGHAAEIDQVITSQGNLGNSMLKYVPMVGRRSFWTVIVDPLDARPVGFLPIDSF